MIHLKKSIRQRTDLLKKLGAAISAYEDKLYDALRKDLAKPRAEAIFTEIAYCQREIAFFINNIGKWAKPVKVKTSWIAFPLATSHILKEPFGKVLIIGPYNYPVHANILPLIGALAAGNTVTLKPSELSWHSATVLKEMLEAYFDRQTIEVVIGGAEKTQELLKKKFDYIFFTGGRTVGKIVMAAAAENLTPVCLELGGKSPCVVDATYDPVKTASRIVFGKFVNAGQTCIAPDYLLVQRTIKDELIAGIKDKIISFFGEDQEQSADYGRIVHTRHFDRLLNYLEDAAIIFGGKTNKDTLYISPTLVDHCENSIIMEEEVFGPILPVITYDNEDEAIAFINNKPRPLALYIFSKNRQFQKKLLSNTSSGGVSINDTMMHAANPHLPFGGTGESGFGRYHGKYSFDTFSHTKSVFKNTTLFELPARFPPYKQHIPGIIKRLFISSV